MITPLERQNPWWERAHWSQEDPQWSAFQRSRLQWEPLLLRQIDLSQDALHVLRGPRQVGKTTLLKLWVAHLLEQGVDPHAVFYYTCDLLSGNGELFTVLDAYRAATTRFSFPRQYIFLDEVTLVEDWQYALKQYSDLTGIQGHTILVTGSSALDLRHGAERLPGRRGGAGKTDWILFPLSFREFLTRTAPQRNCDEIPSFEEILAEPGKLDILRSLWFLGSSNLQTMLEAYLQVGGFPLAVESYLQTGKVEPKVRNVYLSVVRSDIEKHRRSRVILKDLMARLIQTEGSPQSWQNLSRDLGGVSFHTVQDFTETLADSFLLLLVRALDRSHGVASPRKDKKIYFADPFLRSALCEEQGLAGVSQSLQVEAAAGSHLLRLFEREPEEGWSLLKQVYYWRSERGKEVDFLIHRPSSDLPVEVKYQGSIQAEDMATLRRSFDSGVLISKRDLFFRDGIWGIPAAIFLLLE